MNQTLPVQLPIKPRFSTFGEDWNFLPVEDAKQNPEFHWVEASTSRIMYDIIRTLPLESESEKYDSSNAAIFEKPTDLCPLQLELTHLDEKLIAIELAQPLLDEDDYNDEVEPVETADDLEERAGSQPTHILIYLLSTSIKESQLQKRINLVLQFSVAMVYSSVKIDVWLQKFDVGDQCSLTLYPTAKSQNPKCLEFFEVPSDDIKRAVLSFEAMDAAGLVSGNNFVKFTTVAIRKYTLGRGFNLQESYRQRCSTAVQSRPQAEGTAGRHQTIEEPPTLFVHELKEMGGIQSAFSHNPDVKGSQRLDSFKARRFIVVYDDKAVLICFKENANEVMQFQDDLADHKMPLQKRCTNQIFNLMKSASATVWSYGMSTAGGFTWKKDKKPEAEDHQVEQQASSASQITTAKLSEKLLTASDNLVTSFQCPSMASFSKSFLANSNFQQRLILMSELGTIYILDALDLSQISQVAPLPSEVFLCSDQYMDDMLIFYNEAHQKIQGYSLEARKDQKMKAFGMSSFDEPETFEMQRRLVASRKCLLRIPKEEDFDMPDGLDFDIQAKTLSMMFIFKQDSQDRAQINQLFFTEPSEQSSESGEKEDNLAVSLADSSLTSLSMKLRSSDRSNLEDLESGWDSDILNQEFSSVEYVASTPRHSESFEDPNVQTHHLKINEEDPHYPLHFDSPEDSILETKFVKCFLNYVKSIDFSGCSFGLEASQWLATPSILGSCTQLSSLDLSNAVEHLPPEYAELREVVIEDATNFISLMTSYGHELRVIKANNNIMGHFMAVSLEGFLTSKQANKLRRLQLNGCLLGNKGTDLLGHSLCARAIQLQTLELRNNLIEDESVGALCVFLSRQDCLEELDVSHNRLRMGLRSILKALRKSKKTLNSLYIQNNQSINKAAFPLEHIIGTYKQLQFLDISDLNMKKDFIFRIMEALLNRLLHERQERPQQPVSQQQTEVPHGSVNSKQYANTVVVPTSKASVKYARLMEVGWRFDLQRVNKESIAKFLSIVQKIMLLDESSDDEFLRLDLSQTFKNEHMIDEFQKEPVAFDLILRSQEAPEESSEDDESQAPSVLLKKQEQNARLQGSKLAEVIRSANQSKADLTEKTISNEIQDFSNSVLSAGKRGAPVEAREASKQDDKEQETPKDDHLKDEEEGFSIGDQSRPSPLDKSQVTNDDSEDQESDDYESSGTDDFMEDIEVRLGIKKGYTLNPDELGDKVEDLSLEHLGQSGDSEEGDDTPRGLSRALHDMMSEIGNMATDRKEMDTRRSMMWLGRSKQSGKMSDSASRGPLSG